MMTEYDEVYIKNVMNTFFENHIGCIFKSNITSDAIELIRSKWPLSKIEFIDLLEACIIDSELYCPHEGINRLPVA